MLNVSNWFSVHPPFLPSSSNIPDQNSYTEECLISKDFYQYPMSDAQHLTLGLHAWKEVLVHSVLASLKPSLIFCFLRLVPFSVNFLSFFTVWCMHFVSNKH